MLSEKQEEILSLCKTMWRSALYGLKKCDDPNKIPELENELIAWSKAIIYYLRKVRDQDEDAKE